MQSGTVVNVVLLKGFDVVDLDVVGWDVFLFLGQDDTQLACEAFVDEETELGWTTVDLH